MTPNWVCIPCFWERRIFRHLSFTGLLIVPSTKNFFTFHFFLITSPSNNHFLFFDGIDLPDPDVAFCYFPEFSLLFLVYLGCRCDHLLNRNVIAWTPRLPLNSLPGGRDYPFNGFLLSLVAATPPWTKSWFLCRLDYSIVPIFSLMWKLPFFGKYFICACNKINPPFLFQHFLHPFFALASVFDPTSTYSFSHYIFSWFYLLGL